MPPRAARPAARPARKPGGTSRVTKDGSVKKPTPNKRGKAAAGAKTSHFADALRERERERALARKKAAAASAARKEGREVPEKRLRRIRTQPSKAFAVVRQRALSQRFFVIERRRTDARGSGEPEETVELAGSTGNVYTIKINRRPSCNCPHARQGNQCKHIVYVLHRTLHARYSLQYQAALLSTEVREILDNAPAIPSARAALDRPTNTSAKQDEDGGGGVRQKPIESGDDCPICCCPLLADTPEIKSETRSASKSGSGSGSSSDSGSDESAAGEDVVYCRAACGNNIHKACFQQWAYQKTRSNSPSSVPCPLCRTPWQSLTENEVSDVRTVKLRGGLAGHVTEEGYVNVGRQLGLPAYRDESTYHAWYF